MVTHLGAQQIIGDLGLTTNSLKGEATMISTSDSNPLVMTPFDRITLAIPSKHIVTAFINMTLNTKGAGAVSKRLAESGIFSCGQHRLPDIQQHGLRQGRNDGQGSGLVGVGDGYEDEQG